MTYKDTEWEKEELEKWSKFMQSFYADITTPNPEGNTVLIDYNGWAHNILRAIKEAIEHGRALEREEILEEIIGILNKLPCPDEKALRERETIIELIKLTITSRRTSNE